MEPYFPVDWIGVFWTAGSSGVWVPSSEAVLMKGAIFSDSRAEFSAFRDAHARRSAEKRYTHLIISAETLAGLQTDYERFRQKPSRNEKQDQSNNQNGVDGRRFHQPFFECDRSNSKAKIPHATVGRAAPTTNRRRESCTASLTCVTWAGSLVITAAAIAASWKQFYWSSPTVRTLPVGSEPLCQSRAR
jgi:hypothetical protein